MTDSVITQKNKNQEQKNLLNNDDCNKPENLKKKTTKYPR